jgi:hypothetical protein
VIAKDDTWVDSVHILAAIRVITKVTTGSSNGSPAKQERRIRKPGFLQGTAPRTAPPVLVEPLDPQLPVSGGLVCLRLCPGRLELPMFLYFSLDRSKLTRMAQSCHTLRLSNVQNRHTNNTPTSQDQLWIPRHAAAPEGTRAATLPPFLLQWIADGKPQVRLQLPKRTDSQPRPPTCT